MNHLERANALTPGDWSSLRDVIRDLATDIDKLNNSKRSGPVKTSGDAAASNDGSPDATPTR